MIFRSKKLKIVQNGPKVSKIEQFVTFRRKNENNYDLDPKNCPKWIQKCPELINLWNLDGKKRSNHDRLECDIRISKYPHTWIPRTFCYSSIQILNKLRYQTIQNVEFRRKKEAIMINRKSILF